MGITRLSSKGQITIPKEVREELGLKAGDKVIVEAGEQQAFLKPLRKPSESMKGIASKTKRKLGNVTAVELVRAMRREDQEEL